MVISSFISSILVLALGLWAYMKLESSMNLISEKQLLIEPSKMSYKMWKDMPVTMYQSFTFFNLTNWNQVKAIGQKPRFVEVGPYVYRTIWTKSDINFSDEERLVSFAERKQWIFQAHLSKGSEDDQIWTINTPLMTALALIQNAPVITKNIVSVILDGLGEGAFIKRPIRSLLFEGYSDLIVSVGPLFDRRFANFNGKFAYLYNKNDSIDGQWTVSTGSEDLSTLNKIAKFQNNIVNMTTFASGVAPQGLNEVKPECAAAWSLEQATNGQLFASFNQEIELAKQLLAERSRAQRSVATSGQTAEAPPAPMTAPTVATTANPPIAKRFFARNSAHDNHNHISTNHNNNHHHHHTHQQEMVPNPFMAKSQHLSATAAQPEKVPTLKDLGKFIFYPDLCRPIHLLPGKQDLVATPNGIRATRYYIDPRVFMNSTQMPTNKCYEMNPRPPLANTLAATINSVTGANVAMPNLVASASSPFAIFSPPGGSHHGDSSSSSSASMGGLFERSNSPFLNNPLHNFAGAIAGVASNSDQQMSSSNNAPISRLGRVRQLFSNIVSQRMSAASPGSLLPSLAAGPAGMLIGGHHHNHHHFSASPSSTARNSPDEPQSHHLAAGLLPSRQAQLHDAASSSARHANTAISPDGMIQQGSAAVPSAPAAASQPNHAATGGSDRWVTQFRFKWPRGVFSIGQCQLGAPIYASLPHFLDADEYYLEQVDGLKPNRSLHEFYIDIESTLHSVPVGAKARLQLNVATPELRFRNIPNAMIPVLWQEVTFEIDKPVQTLLFWSFTMLSTLCTIASLVLIALGFLLMAKSFLGGYRQRQTKLSTTDGASVHSSSSTTSSTRRHRPEGQRSSWRPHLMGPSHQHALRRNNPIGGLSNLDEEIRHGAAVNHAFGSCREFQDRLSDGGHQISTGSGPSSGLSVANGTGTPPNQLSSRASSHCELVSSLSTVTCSGCLLACLRHSQANVNGAPNIHAVTTPAGTIDSGAVIQQQHHHHHQIVATSDIEKATILSTAGSASSSSSVYSRKSKIFKSR